MLRLATLELFRAVLSSREYVRIPSNSSELWWSSISVVMGSLVPCICGTCVLHTPPTWYLCHWTEMKPVLGVCVSRATTQPPGLRG